MGFDYSGGLNMTDFQILLENIASYYGEGSDEWVEIAKYGLSGDNAASIFKQTPGVNYTVSSSGKVLNYSIIKDVETSASESIPTIIDSNLQTGTASRYDLYGQDQPRGLASLLPTDSGQPR